VVKFIEKPNENHAKKIIKKKGYWNSGILFVRKDSVINNFRRYQPKMLHQCIDAVYKSKVSKNVYYLNKKSFEKIEEKSFDYAILEKSKNIYGIKLNIPLTDLGNWKEIWKFFKKNKSKSNMKRNTFYRPWGKYINLYSGKGFLLKELILIQNHRLVCKSILIDLNVGQLFRVDLKLQLVIINFLKNQMKQLLFQKEQFIE